MTRPATRADVERVFRALDLLRAARGHLKIAMCPAAAAKVRRAIKSTEGALRHVRRRETEWQQ